MRTIKRYIPVFLLCMIIWFVASNPDKVINFFDGAETHLANHLGEFSSNGYLVTENDLAGLEDSGITGKDCSFDTKYYPYYDLLTVEEQLLYKQIYANMNALAYTFVPLINVSIEEVKIAMEAVYNDHPELFWINTSYTYKYIENDIVVQITLSYNDTSKNIDASKQKFETVANKIIEGANNYSTDYEKEKYVHDEILKLVNYNTNASMNQSAYSALVNKQTVCAGYARAFQYIMIELGIPTYYISGYSNQDHAWNIVKLDNDYYNVDLTWNDANQNHHQFFNLTDDEFKKTHTRSNLSNKLPTCNSTKYKYVQTTNNEVPTTNTTPSNNNTNNNWNSNINTNSNTTPNIVNEPVIENSNISNTHHYENNSNHHYEENNHHNYYNSSHHNNHH